MKGEWKLKISLDFTGIYRKPQEFTGICRKCLRGLSSMQGWALNTAPLFLQKEKSIVPTIEAGDAMSLEEALKVSHARSSAFKREEMFLIQTMR